MRNATIARMSGQWFIVFACEIAHESPANENPDVGIDRGIARTLTLSTGEHASVPEFNTASRLRAARGLARAKRGSARRAKAKACYARACSRIAAARNHWLHEVSTDLANRFGFVALEKLRVVNMTRKGRMLSDCKEVLD